MLRRRLITYTPYLFQKKFISLFKVTFYFLTWLSGEEFGTPKFIEN
jgi:hypothetical protein